MTLSIEDLDTSHDLATEDRKSVRGGMGPTSGPGAGLGQLTGQNAENSIVGSAASTGVLNTTLNLQLMVAPQISVATGTLVDLDAVTDLTNVVNSVLS